MRFAMFLPLAVAAGLVCADANACGDKFLVAGRGVKYTRVRAAAHPASILVYLNPAAHLPAAAKDLESGLKQAGHRVRTVADAGALEGALKSVSYDLVLADITDSPALERQVSARSSSTIVVPVLYRPTAEQLAAAKRQYGCAMKSPGKSYDYLDVIDAAMSTRNGAKPK